MIDVALRPHIGKFVIVYLDDNLVFSETERTFESFDTSVRGTSKEQFI